MDPFYIALISIGLLVVLLVSGVHVAVAMITAGVVGVWWITGSFITALNLIGNTSYTALMDYTFGAIPMFVVMGMLIIRSGSSEELYDAAGRLFNHFKGGVAIATVAANAVFAAVTGVSMASVVIFSKVAIPEMRRLGYNHRFAIGTVAGSSVLGMLIPPSVLLILYGILAEESIGKLFLAGIIPGIILAVVYSAGIFLMVSLRPDIARGTQAREVIPWKHQWKQLLGASSIVVIMLVVIGGIYLGWFTPTEAGAVGAVLALILTIIRKKISIAGLSGVMLETGYAIAGVYLLFIGARMFSRMLTISGLPAEAAGFVASLQVGPIAVIWLFVFIILIMGTILDSASILVVCMPLMAPVLNALNIDLIWFGILCIIAVEMGLLTPPFGMIAYGMPALLGGDCTIADVFIGAAPFLVMMLLVLTLLVFVPQLCTWLPSLM